MTETGPPDRLFRRLVEEMPEAVVFADRQGAIRLWNPGAEAMFGYSAEEALGRSLDLIIPERYRARHWDGYRQVMSTGATRYGQRLLAVPAVRKDGRRMSIEFSIALLRDEHGEVIGAAAVVRDVTARWQADRELRKRVAALEARPGGEDPNRQGDRLEASGEPGGADERRPPAS